MKVLCDQEMLFWRTNHHIPLCRIFVDPEQPTSLSNETHPEGGDRDAALERPNKKSKSRHPYREQDVSWRLAELRTRVPLYPHASVQDEHRLYDSEQDQQISPDRSVLENRLYDSEQDQQISPDRSVLENNSITDTASERRSRNETIQWGPVPHPSTAGEEKSEVEE